MSAVLAEKNWDARIETYTGKKIQFLEPTPEMFDINDIAHALSNMCRYTGHCKNFYSVAEHSVVVSLLVPKEFAMEGLLHDASEAILTDVASPIKPYLSNYKQMESTLMVAIGKKFGFTWPNSQVVKDADVAALSTEAFYLMPGQGTDWPWERMIPDGRPPIEARLAPHCYDPKVAKEVFLKRYYEILQGL